MTFLAFILGTLTSAVPACIWNFLTAGNFRKLVYLIISSCLGFWIGHLLALWRGWNFLKLGPIYLGTALIFSIVFVIASSWLNISKINK